MRTKCYEVEQEIPYGVVVDLVSRALDTWPSHLFQDVSPLALAELTLLVPEMVKRFPALPAPPPALPKHTRPTFFRHLSNC